MFFLEISTFFGRFHPLLVHLPIGFLILAVLISIKQKDKNLTYTKILRLIWFLAFISSFFSAIMGLLLAENGHYIENDLSLHKWTGIALVCLSFLGWLFHLNLFNISILLKKINNSFIILFIFIVGHLGGSLTHGKDYLFRFSPEVVRTKLITKTKPISFKKASLDSVYVFNDIIQPLFNNKCVACHNEIIKRGGLNMTTSLNLLEGGKSGAAIVPKDPGKSLAFNRVILSQYDQEFMPPTGVPLNYEEIQLLEWWIKEGAPTNIPISKMKIDPNIQSLLFKNYSLDTKAKPWYEKVVLDKLNSEVFIELEKHNFSCRNLSINNSLLDIRYNGSKINDTDLEVLERYAPYITWLNLSESQLKKNHVKRLSKMENLTRLSLQKNFIDTEAITPLLYLEHLEILNLHSTQVDKNLFDLIKSMNSLKKVFIWNTNITSDQIKNQKGQFNSIEIIGNLE